jgi:hypothetical protein
MRSPRLAAVIALALVVLASSCGAGRNVRRTPGAQLIPVSGQRFLAFADARIDHFEGAVVAKQTPLDRPGAGRALMSAVDRPTGRACVAYERALAVVNPEDVDWTWHDAPWRGAVTELAYVDERVVACEGSIIHVFDLARGGAARSHDVRSILQAQRHSQLCFAMPVKGSADELLVVTAKRNLSADPAGAAVARVSTARGDCTLVNAGIPIGALISNVQRCTTDGKSLYLAGSLDYSARPMQFDQDITVVRVDPSTGNAAVLVRERLDVDRAGYVEIVDVIAGGDLVVILEAQKRGIEQARAFKVVEAGGGTGAQYWKKDCASGSVLAWLNPPRFAIFENGVLSIQQ